MNPKQVDAVGFSPSSRSPVAAALVLQALKDLTARQRENLRSANYPADGTIFVEREELKRESKLIHGAFDRGITDLIDSGRVEDHGRYLGLHQDHTETTQTKEPDMSALTVKSQPNAQLPTNYESAKQALAECARVDECKDWVDKAAALAFYAKQASDDQLLKDSNRIKARAARRMGELFNQIEPAKGGGGDSTRGVAPPGDGRAQAARDAGVSQDQRKQSQRVASIPEDTFEEAVESEDPPTLTDLAGGGKRNSGEIKGLSKKAAQKLRAHIKAFNRDYEARVDEGVRTALESLLETYNRDNERHVRVVNAYDGPLSHQDFKLISGLLHSDRLPGLDDTQKARYDKGFNIMQEKRLELCGLDEGVELSNTLPKTVAELLAKRKGTR